MTVLRSLTIVGVPVLLGVPRLTERPLPTVLWFHGFRADSLAHAADLEACADAGFLSVGVDAVGHGARRDETLNARVARAGGDAMPILLEQISATIVEVPSLLDALVNDFGADRARISVVGVSMGALLVYAMLPLGMPLRAAVALLGSPTHVPTVDIVRACRTVALLSVTAEHDVNVPPEPAIALHATLGPSSHHHVLLGSGHLTSAVHWREAMHVTLAWLDEHGR